MIFLTAPCDLPGLARDYWRASLPRYEHSDVVPRELRCFVRTRIPHGTSQVRNCQRIYRLYHYQEVKRSDTQYTH